MLVNLNKVDKKGSELYRNALSGRVAPLSMQDFHPSQRRQKRIEMGISKRASSTKTTKNTKKVASKLAQFLGFVFGKKNKK